MFFFFQAEDGIRDYKVTGVQTCALPILRRALEEPVRWIVQNAGQEGSIVVSQVREAKNKNFGYNAQTDTFEDLVAAGVIDPTKVTRTALQDRKSTRLNSSHLVISYAVFCLKKKTK